MTVKYAWGTSSEIALSWLSLFLTYDNPTLAPVMLTQFYGAPCHQAFILWHQAFILINAEILLTVPLEIHFTQILIEIHAFSVNKMHLKLSFVKMQPFSLRVLFGNNPLSKLVMVNCQ